MTYEKRWDEKRWAGIRWEELRWDEVWSVKGAVWSVGREECSVKCGVWSVDCEVWSVECEVSSVECEVWSVDCEVWSVECEVWSVECAVGSVQCEVWSVECEVWSVKCGVWSVKCEVELQMWHVKQDTTFEECMHARAWLAHVACKFYRWERSYVYPYGNFRPASCRYIYTSSTRTRRGGSCLGIYIRPFSSIELACDVRQPSPCVRELCESCVLSHMSHLKLHFALRTSHFSLHSSHSTPPNQTDRTQEVPFIAGCSHFTRKNTRFPAPASSPQHRACNIHAAIPMRSATTASRNA